MSTMRQPMIVYPQPTTTRHIQLKYVPVFIAVGVITALAVLACYVGQILARRYLRPMTRKNRDFYPAMDTGNEVGMSMPDVRMNTSSKPMMVSGDPKGEIFQQEIRGMRTGAIPPVV